MSNNVVTLKSGSEVPLGIGHRRRDREKPERWGYQRVEKVFKIGLAILTQYRRVTDIHPSFHSKYHTSKKHRGGKNVTNTKYHNLISSLLTIGVARAGNLSHLLVLPGVSQDRSAAV